MARNGLSAEKIFKDVGRCKTFLESLDLKDIKRLLRGARKEGEYAFLCLVVPVTTINRNRSLLKGGGRRAANGEAV